jgi:hypothetical protein
MPRRAIAAVVACLVLGLTVAGAYHDHGSPFGCRSTPHVHAAEPHEGCPVCRLPRLREPGPEPVQAGAPLADPQSSSSLLQVPPDLFVVCDRPARAPPSALTTDS